MPHLREVCSLLVVILASFAQLAAAEAQEPVRQVPTEPPKVDSSSAIPLDAKAVRDWIQGPEVRATFNRVGDLRGSGKPIIAVALSVDGNHVIACDSEGDCRVWDVSSGQESGRIVEKLPGKALSVAVGLQGKRGIIGCDRGGIVWWDTATGKIVGKYEVPKAAVTDVSVLPKRPRTMAFDREGMVHRVEANASAEQLEWMANSIW
jgi:WD40 repeat protein